MTYREAREFIANAAKKGSILGLKNITRLMKELGNVQDSLKVVHIAGTNGKGSTLAFMQEILRAAGYKVGRYTSPAVFDYLEIFTINGENISEEAYAKNMSAICRACDKIEKEGYAAPTAFEIETALAYLYFYNEKCDIVLIETGMGGDADATNVVNNTLLSILTTISLDHMAFLGDTIAEIASHKAGIIKEHSTVVSAEQSEEALEVIKKAAEEKNAELIGSGKPENIRYLQDSTIFDYVCWDNTMRDDTIKKNESKKNVIKENVIKENNIIYDIKIPLCGTFQPYNCALAISAVMALQRKGFDISESDIRAGVENTVWHGRFEKLCDTPLVYFDGGHNPGASEFIRKSIEIYFTNKRIIYIIGVLADKDYETVLKRTCEPADAIITVTPDNKRALDASLLREAALKYNSNVMATSTIEEAVRLAEKLAGREGVIMIFGSLSYLRAVRDICKMKD